MIAIIAINDNTMNKFKYYEQIIAIIDNTIMNKDLLVFWRGIEIILLVSNIGIILPFLTEQIPTYSSG
jgi:hypothetical protein